MIFGKKTLVCMLSCISIFANSAMYASAISNDKIINSENTIAEVSTFSTNFTSVPGTWKYQGKVGNTSKSLPATYVTYDLKTGEKVLRPFWFVNFENFDDGTSNDGKRGILPYVSKQIFSSDGKRFVFARNDDGDSTGTLYEYNITTQSVRLLHEGVSCSSSLEAYVAENDKLYFYTGNREVYCIDWAGEAPYDKYYICKLPTSVYGMHVTNDGRYINGYVTVGGSQHCTRFDMQNLNRNGYANKDFDYAHNFTSTNPDSSGMGHVQINPTDPDLSFFCNEGTTNYIPDRLWIYNHRTKSAHNTFRQSYNPDGTTAECSGHEVWSENGEYLYFVKYTNDQQKGQNGIVRIPFKPTGEYNSNGYPILEDSGEREYINGDYSYWHMFPSGDNRWCVGDINQPSWGFGAKYGWVRVALMSTLTYESYPLVTYAPAYGSQHPHQPHARISNGGETVAWQMSLHMSNGYISPNVGVGYMDITDITKADSNGSILRGAFGNHVMLKWKNVEDAPSDVTKSGDYQKISPRKNLYIDINDALIKNECIPVKLTVSFLDKGRNPIKLVYTGGVMDNTYLHNFADKEIRIPKTGSGNVKTVTVDLGYANFNNINGFASDIYLTSDTETLYIKSVDAVTYDKPDYGVDLTQKNNYYIKAETYSNFKNGIDVYQNYNIKFGNSLFNLSKTDTNTLLGAGVSQEAIDYAHSNGQLYVGSNSDGCWQFADKTDSDGVTKTAWYSTYYARKTGMTGGNIYFRVETPNINKNTKSLNVTFTYLDNSTKAIVLDYTSDSDTGLTRVNIPRNNSGKWVTKTITINDSSASSSNSGTKLADQKADFKFSGGADFYMADFALSNADNNDITTKDLYVENISWYNGSSVVNNSSWQPGSTVTPKAMVVNNTDKAQKVLLFMDAATNKGEKAYFVVSDMTEIPAKGSATVSINYGIRINQNNTLRYSVLSSNMKILDIPKGDILETKAEYLDGDVIVSWQSFGEGYVYNVYRDGELIEANLTGTEYIFPIESSYRHTYRVTTGKTPDNIEYYGNIVALDLTK